MEINGKLTVDGKEIQLYNGNRLLSMRDLKDRKPEVYICTSNRNGGKTTFFNALRTKKFLDKGEKTAYLYRYAYELDDVEDKVFKNIREIYFPEHNMESKIGGGGVFRELFLDGESCGYAMALNQADQIKKYSHLMSDADCIVFDEFQPETGRYCKNEFEKFMSIHTSLARCPGRPVKYLPVIMISNPVTLLNPYYSKWKIAGRLRPDTKFVRGNGWVMEQGNVLDSAKMLQNSAFADACMGQKYMEYAAQCHYLNDSSAFVQKMSGRNTYICTIKYMGREYGVREYIDEGIVYIDDRPDSNYRLKITVTTADHNVNYVMLKRNDLFISTLKWYFEKGCFRVKNLECKEALLGTLSYKF